MTNLSFHKSFHHFPACKWEKPAGGAGTHYLLIQEFPLSFSFFAMHRGNYKQTKIGTSYTWVKSGGKGHAYSILVLPWLFHFLHNPAVSLTLSVSPSSSWCNDSWNTENLISFLWFAFSVLEMLFSLHLGSSFFKWIPCYFSTSSWFHAIIC